MATRSEILFYEEGYKDPIVFYQHWDGYELPHIVADAFEKSEKKKLFYDTPPFGSLIFAEMLRHSDGDAEFYGISFSRTELCRYTIEIRSSYDQRPEITLNGDHYTFQEFQKEFLKPYGAFDHKKKSKNFQKTSA